MTMSRVKDTAELLSPPLNEISLEPCLYHAVEDTHCNCIIAEADALSSTAATASQDKALLTSVPSNPVKPRFEPPLPNLLLV